MRLARAVLYTFPLKCSSKFKKTMPSFDAPTATGSSIGMEIEIENETPGA
jgi:hypothetical protein